MVGNLEHISADPDPQRLLDGAADGGSDPDGANIRSGILSARENSAVRSEARRRGRVPDDDGRRLAGVDAHFVRIDDLPMTPEKILRAIKAQGGARPQARR